MTLPKGVINTLEIILTNDNTIKNILSLLSDFHKINDQLIIRTEDYNLDIINTSHGIMITAIYNKKADKYSEEVTHKIFVPND